jgi:hypothetical protein
MPIPFESEAWRRADPIANHCTVRSQMIDDLLQRHDFNGMTDPCRLPTNRLGNRRIPAPPMVKDCRGLGIGAIFTSFAVASIAGMSEQFNFNMW